MTVIDTHAHWTPERYRRAVTAHGSWHGLDSRVGELESSGFRMSVDERIADMDALGVDVQVLSPTAGFYQYDNAVDTAAEIARECNDEIADVVSRAPGRFLGLATLPMQELSVAIAELKRATNELRLRGIVIGDHVNGRLLDEPEYLPFWAEVERLGAIVFFHQGPDRLYPSIGRYHLDNTIGNLVDRAMLFAVLACGGVLDRHPRLKLLLGHAGGYAAFGAARMDKAAGAFPADRRDGLDDSYVAPYRSTPEYRAAAAGPPTSYLRRFFFDSCTFTAITLRFLIDVVGRDRVVLGTDAPTPMVLTDGPRWIRGLDVLTDAEKRAILEENAAALFGQHAQATAAEQSAPLEA